MQKIANRRSSFLFFLVSLLLVNPLKLWLLPSSFAWAEHEQFVEQEVTINTFNPGCGLELTALHHEVGGRHWYKGVIGIAYKRFHWSDLQPDENSLNLTTLREFIKRWSSAGYRVAFGVMSCSMRRQSTPEWVFDTGVPYVVRQIKEKRTGAKKLIKNPIFWNEHYISLQTKFIRRLGRALEGGEGIEHIDIRALGTWGEMHLIGYTRNELARFGFSGKVYAECYKRIIDEFTKAFPKTILLLPLGNLYEVMLPYSDLALYAVENGVGFRFDGLSRYRVYRGQIIAQRIFQKYGTNDNPLGKSAPCLYEFASKLSDPRVIEKCLQNAIQDNVSYVHLNLGRLDALPLRVQEFIKVVSRKIGYRFVISKVSVGDSLGKGLDGFRLWITLGNIGSSWCPFDSQLYIVLLDKLGRKIEDTRMRIHTARWAPSDFHRISLKMKGFADCRSTSYEIIIGMKVYLRCNYLVPVGISWRQSPQGIDSVVRMKLQVDKKDNACRLLIKRF